MAVLISIPDHSAFSPSPSPHLPFIFLTTAILIRGSYLILFDWQFCDLCWPFFSCTWCHSYAFFWEMSIWIYCPLFSFPTQYWNLNPGPYAPSPFYFIFQIGSCFSQASLRPWSSLVAGITGMSHHTWLLFVLFCSC
jgi:hypothetical protein